MKGRPINPSMIERLRRVLLEEQRLLVCSLQRADAALDVLERDHESDEGERAQENAAADVIIGLEHEREARLDEIERALSRIDTGVYGLCAHCDMPIPLERLQAVPTTVHCRECQGADEEKSVRPLRRATAELLV